ncbi:CARDB domain-containing protein [Conexibacter sp. DBS9H8]|uniref:CARDB domain-containing protein n=1 Tax=Conexibacter sp. DBS9H8 TaxID=2937801 RepID=UPI00200EB86A|nr:CARDB domain-containing protein [Conexibacter sp. DBS9H8]
MSFFDDDDPIEETTHPARPAVSAGPRRGSPRGSGAGPTGGRAGSAARSVPARRRVSTPNAAVERRRLIAIGVLIVVVILMILLISSCQAANTRSSLENYNNAVSSLISRSDATGRTVFSILSSGKGGSTIASNLAGPLQAAEGELTAAQGLAVPGQMQTAQTDLLLALRMRADGIGQIARNAGQLSGSVAAQKAALTAIALGTARFYASDVIYKAYAAPAIAGALHGDNISVGATSNIQINGGQFLTDLGWLQTSFIATKLGANPAAVTGSPKNTDQPGVHGDALVSAAVGSTTLQPGVTNTVPGSPAPTFVLSVSNGGQFNEYNVGCTVTVSGGPTGHATVPETTPGNTSTCNVTLPSTVSPGTYQVTASVAKVPGETNLANNSATYTIQFQ